MDKQMDTQNKQAQPKNKPIGCCANLALQGGHDGQALVIPPGCSHHLGPTTPDPPALHSMHARSRAWYCMNVRMHACVCASVTQLPWACLPLFVSHMQQGKQSTWGDCNRKQCARIGAASLCQPMLCLDAQHDTPCAPATHTATLLITQNTHWSHCRPADHSHSADHEVTLLIYQSHSHPVNHTSALFVDHTATLSITHASCWSDRRPVDHTTTLLMT